MRKSGKPSHALVGRVIYGKIDKGATILVERRVKHPLYKKYILQSVKFLVHDEKNVCNQGDTVSIIQCRPISRKKRWCLQNIISRAC